MYSLIGEIVQVGTPEGVFMGTLQAVSTTYLRLREAARFNMGSFAHIKGKDLFISGSFVLFKADMNSDLYLQYRSAITGIVMPSKEG